MILALPIWCSDIIVVYGVIDFGDVIVGDPDNDFLCLLDCSMDDFGKDFGRKVLRHYGHRNPQLAEEKQKSMMLTGRYSKSCLVFREKIGRFSVRDTVNF